MVLKLQSASECPGGLLKTLAAQSHFQFLTLKVWGEAREFAFLSSLLLAWEPHFENHCSEVSVLDTDFSPWKGLPWPLSWLLEPRLGSRSGALTSVRADLVLA